MEQVKDIQLSQLEEEYSKERSLDAAANKKRTSHKALELLGHDPSVEKVKKTLGLDEEEIEKARMENIENEENRLLKKRILATPYNKKEASKALTTLGFDPSMHRSMKRLGLKEETFRKALSEENLRIEKRIMHSRKNLGTRNRKENRKALHIVGFDPSKEKALHQLGSEASKEIEEIFSPKSRPKHKPAPLLSVLVSCC